MAPRKLTELDLTGTYRDYGEIVNNGGTGTIYNSPKRWAELHLEFQKTMEFVNKQKHCLPADLFSLLENVNFLSLIPMRNSTVDPNWWWISGMARETHTVISEYAFKLRDLDMAVVRLHERIKDIEEGNDDGYSANVLESHKESMIKIIDEAFGNTIQAIEEVVQETQTHFRVIDDSIKNIRKNHNHFENYIYEKVKDNKDVHILLSKRMNHLEAELSNHISHTISSTIIVMMVFAIMIYVISIVGNDYINQTNRLFTSHIDKISGINIYESHL